MTDHYNYDEMQKEYAKMSDAELHKLAQGDDYDTKIDASLMLSKRAIARNRSQEFQQHVLHLSGEVRDHLGGLRLSHEEFDAIRRQSSHGNMEFFQEAKGNRPKGRTHEDPRGRDGKRKWYT